MRTLLRTMVLALLLLPGSRALAQTAADPTGHWEGTVAAPMGQIDFDIDVARDASGTLVATYGQKAQGLRGLPLTKVSLEGRTFTFVLFNGGPGGGSFKGEILSDGKTMAGEVTATLGSAPFNLYRTGDAAMLPPIKNVAVSAGLQGRWTGALDVGGRQIGIILTVANRPDGTASVRIAQADRPDLQFDVALTEAATGISLEVPATSGTWAGTLSDGELTGTWTQPGGSLPLTFKK